MKLSFKNPKEFENFFKKKYSTNPTQQISIIEIALEASCKFLQGKAKEKFGHYQTGWQQLADATKKDRVAKGYPENEPLLRDGTLRDSVEYEVRGNKAIVGSKDIIMVYQEKGTTKTGWGKGIPPRPVFLLTQIQYGSEAVSLFFKTFIKQFSRQ